MGLLFIIIVCALTILVLAFIGVLGRFPDNWQWVGIVLAGWGIVIGAPTLLQMIMGRPRLISEYTRIVENQKRSLAIFLKNPPLNKNSVWGKLGVRRDTIQSLIISFRISEMGSGKILIPIMHARIFSDDDPADTGRNRIALPPTFHSPATVMIVRWDESKNKAIIPGDRIRQAVELPSGEYRADVLLVIDGDPRKEYMHFIVGNTSDELTWIKPTQSTSHKEVSST